MLPILGPIFDIVDKLIPDPNGAQKLKNDLETQYTQQMQLQQSIIMKEMTEGNWLSRNWRSCCMLVFMIMLILYFIMYEIIPYVIVLFDLHYITPQDPGLNDQLTDVIKVGLGGYLTSHGVETVARIVKK